MKYCQKCGARVKGEERICTNCGGPVEPDKAKPVLKPAESDKKEEPKLSKEQKIIILLSAIILVLLVGILTYFCVQIGNSSKKQKNPEPQNEKIKEDKPQDTDNKKDDDGKVVDDGKNTDVDTDTDKIKFKDFDASKLPYYDFVKEKCKKDGESAWEVTADLNEKGFQVDENKIEKPDEMFEVILKKQDFTKEEFNTEVQLLKYRLNTLKTPYAIKYENNKESYNIVVKLEENGLDALKTRLLSYRKEDDSKLFALKSSDEFSLSDVAEFSYEKNSDGGYEMSVSKKDISENERKGLLKFLEENNDKKMAWYYGDTKLAEFKIDDGLVKEFEKTGKLKFTKLSISGDKEQKDEELLPLVELIYVVNAEKQYPFEMEIKKRTSVEKDSDKEKEKEKEKENDKGKDKDSKIAANSELLTN